MTDVIEELLQRECYGCGIVDDAPRFQHITGSGDDELYHYDCIPAGVLNHHGVQNKNHPAHAIWKACVAGTRNHELRKLAVKHAASIVEAPADKNQKD